MKGLITVITCSALFALASCSKSNATNPQIASGWAYAMTETINGTKFTRDTCVFWYFSAADSGFSSQILGGGNIPGNPNYYPQVSFSFTYYHGVGTYPISNMGAPCEAGVRTTSDTAGDYSVSGSLTISAVYPNVVGTFNFTTSKGTIVSNGSFVAQRLF